MQSPTAVRMPTNSYSVQKHDSNMSGYTQNTQKSDKTTQILSTLLAMPKTRLQETISRCSEPAIFTTLTSNRRTHLRVTRGTRACGQTSSWMRQHQMMTWFCGCCGCFRGSSLFLRFYGELRWSFFLNFREKLTMSENQERTIKRISLKQRSLARLLYLTDKIYLWKVLKKWKRKRTISWFIIEALQMIR